MNQKIYPKTVVLRKGIVSSVVVGVVNQMPKQKQGDAFSVKSVATQSDKSWYLNQTISKPAAIVTPQKNTSVVKQTADLPQTLNAIKDSKTDVTQQELLKAMSAPINSNQLTDERQTTSQDTNRSITRERSESPHSSSDQNMQNEKKAFIQAHSNELSHDFLASTVEDPMSPYEIQAGTIIPGILVTGIISDLPGQITGRVRANVYDSISGKHLLIPQGSTLLGLYDSQVAYGQERLLVVWNRIVFPNGQSINLAGMPGVDMSGYAGFHDQVDNHYAKIFGSVVLMSLLGAGAQLSQPQNTSNSIQAPTVGQSIAQSVGTNLINTGTMITAKNINIQPTLNARQAYEFNISVKKYIVFAHPYVGK